MSRIEDENPPKIDDKDHFDHHHHHQSSKLSVPSLPVINLDKDKDNSPMNITSPRQRSALAKSSSSARLNCLCSPTTHVGSFRCRFHRSPASMVRGRSVGSCLSELASTSPSIRDQLL